MAILRLTPQAVRQLLQLPDEVDVIRVEVPQNHRSGLDVVIEGAGWPTPEGGLIQSTHGTVTQGVDAEGKLIRYEIDWGLPASTGK